MPFRRLPIYLIGLLATSVCCHAATTSSFQYVPSTTTATLTPGGSTDISVYLVETYTTGTTPVLVKDGGLYSGAFKLTASATGTSYTSIGTLTSNSASPPSGFGSGNAYDPTPSSGVGTLDENVGNSMTGVAATAVGSNQEQIYLGSVHFVAPSGGSSTSFTISGISDTYTNTGEMLDGTTSVYTAATGSSILITTPEPNSGMAALPLVLLLRRRRNLA